MKNNIVLLTILIIGSIVKLNGQINPQKYRFSQHIHAITDSDTTEWRYQTAAANFSFIGDYKNTLAAWDKAMPKVAYIPTSTDSLLLRSSKIQTARSYIIERAKNEKIIIINEAHHNPKHRTFTKSLLKDLYRNGYRYLGLEAISDTAINERGYAVESSGFYMVEPEFGNLVYQAKKLGFVIFGYEAFDGKNGREREIKQAKNVHEFMKSHTDGKYIIHCGFDHVYENEVSYWEKAMAGRLKEYTGIDAFTIDQVKLSEHSDSLHNHYFLNATDEKAPFILKSPDQGVFNGFDDPKQTDILVIHPITQYKYERPTWLASDKFELWLRKKLRKYGYPIQILAYREGEYENGGIPADVIEINNKCTNKPLFLGIGKYTIIVRNNSYEVIDKFQTSVR